MLLIAWGIHNGPPLGTLPPCLNAQLKYIRFAPRKHPYQAHQWMAAEKKLTHPLPNLAGTRKHFKQVTFSNFASLADPLCFIKVPSIHTQARHFFGTLIHHLPALLAFLIKLLVFALTTCLSLLACGVTSSIVRDFNLNKLILPQLHTIIKENTQSKYPGDTEQYKI